MKNMYLTVVLGILVLTGCNSNEYGGPDTPGAKAEIWGSISSPQTRYHGSMWGQGESIGVSVTGGDTGSTNILYQCSGENEQLFTAVGDHNDIYIKGNGKVSLTAYHPYTGINGTAGGLVTVDTKSENQTATNQLNIDWLFAEATTTRSNPLINFQFTHQLSQLSLIFKNKDESKPENVSYTLKGFITKGFFNTSNGTTSLGTESEDVSVLVNDNTSTTSTLILLPQEVVQTTIEVVADGVFYEKTIDNITLESNRRHLYTVTLGGEGENPSITITESGITDWQPGNGGNINSTTDAPETDTAFDSSYWNNSGETKYIKSLSNEK